MNKYKKDTSEIYEQLTLLFQKWYREPLNNIGDTEDNKILIEHTIWTYLNCLLELQDPEFPTIIYPASFDIYACCVMKIYDYLYNTAQDNTNNKAFINIFTLLTQPLTRWFNLVNEIDDHGNVYNYTLDHWEIYKRHMNFKEINLPIHLDRIVFSSSKQINSRKLFVMDRSISINEAKNIHIPNCLTLLPEIESIRSNNFINKKIKLVAYHNKEKEKCKNHLGWIELNNVQEYDDLYINTNYLDICRTSKDILKSLINEPIPNCIYILPEINNTLSSTKHADHKVHLIGRHLPIPLEECECSPYWKSLQSVFKEKYHSEVCPEGRKVVELKKGVFCKVINELPQTTFNDLFLIKISRKKNPISLFGIGYRIDKVNNLSGIVILNSAVVSSISDYLSSLYAAQSVNI